MTRSEFNESMMVRGFEFSQTWGVRDVAGVDIRMVRIGEMGVLSPVWKWCSKYTNYTAYISIS